MARRPLGPRRSLPARRIGAPVEVWVDRADGQLTMGLIAGAIGLLALGLNLRAARRSTGRSRW